MIRGQIFIWNPFRGIPGGKQKKSTRGRLLFLENAFQRVTGGVRLVAYAVRKKQAGI